MGRYDIRQVASDRFDLYEDGVLLCSWSRSTFRESISTIAYSSNWIGSILRLFNKKFPLPFRPHFQTPIERAESVYGEFVLADYLRSKGLRVVKPMPVSDVDIVNILESKGYLISGMIGDVYYETKGERNVERKSAVTKEE